MGTGQGPQDTARSHASGESSSVVEAIWPPWFRLYAILRLSSFLAGAITRHGLSIQSAHIDNYGERAVDAFYVQDKGAKLSGRKAQALKSSLMDVLGEADVAAPRGGLALERARASVAR